MAITKTKRSSPPKKRPAHRPTVPSRPPAERSALNQPILPGGRSIEFPQVKSKTIEKIEMFTSAEYHCITIDFQDRSSLNLRIKPGFTISAELHQHKEDETLTLAQWPPFSSEQ